MERMPLPPLSVSQLTSTTPCTLLGWHMANLMMKSYSHYVTRVLIPAGNVGSSTVTKDNNTTDTQLVKDSDQVQAECLHVGEDIVRG